MMRHSRPISQCIGSKIVEPQDVQKHCPHIKAEDIPVWSKDTKGRRTPPFEASIITSQGKGCLNTLDGNTGFSEESEQVRCLRVSISKGSRGVGETNEMPWH